MKHIISNIKTKLKTGRAAPGQSLVEMAIITPLLIFMLIGLFEVGWALRGYLTLVNANREITRYSIRPGYLNYTEIDPVADDYGVGYEEVRDYLYTTLANQLGLNLDVNGTLIISHIVADTGWPCEKDVVLAGNCDCDAYDPTDDDPTIPPFVPDDLILYPGKPDFDLSYTYIYTYPYTTTHRSRIDFAAEAEKLARENDKFNCELLSKTKGSAVPSANNLITTELFFGQPQLFGFPLISNPFTDPVPMYTHTTMRMTGAPRSADNTDTVGPVCIAYPIVVKEDTILNRGSDNRIDIFDGKNPPGGGGSGGDWGWLAWDPAPPYVGSASNSEQYLELELQYPRLSFNNYINARDANDRTLSVNDYVASLSGLNTGVNNPTNGYVDALVGKEIIIPVWDTFDTSGVDAYHIVGFARVRIESKDDIDIPGKEIIATYIDDASDCKVIVSG